MTNFMNWLGKELQTAGSCGSVAFKFLIVMAIVWVVMTIWEHMS